MRTLFAAMTIAAALLSCGGCVRQQYLTPERLDNGLVVVLTGIEGRSPLNRDIVRGLVDGGVKSGMEIQDWTSWLGPLYSLRAELRNRRKAGRIAVHISEYKFANPGKPVFLVGQSGGGAMALWIAESMPEGQEVDGVILLEPSISPRYMIDYALSKTRRGVVNFYSSRDWFFLGVGTTITGTMDGRHTSSAGRVGFEVSPQLDPTRQQLYNKLFQIAWHKQMAATGHTGGHLSSSAEAFIADYVAPLINADKWSDELIAKIISGRKVLQ